MYKLNLPEVERKWQKKWADTGLYKYEQNSNKPKEYVLEMFSYPSGAKLHAGHWYNYSLADNYARLKRMQGYNALWVPGTDHAAISTEVNEVQLAKE